MFKNSIVPNIYQPPMKSREGNLFSHVCMCACLFTMGSHVTITHDVLNIPVQEPQSWTWDLNLQSSSSDIMWPGLESCSNLFTWGPCHQCWHLGVIEACMVGASGRCASYWCAFLLIYDFWDCQRKIFLCPVTHPTCQERYWYLPCISCILFFVVPYHVIFSVTDLDTQ